MGKISKKESIIAFISSLSEHYHFDIPSFIKWEINRIRCPLGKIVIPK